jgi:hypothetical protein
MCVGRIYRVKPRWRQWLLVHFVEIVVACLEECILVLGNSGWLSVESSDVESCRSDQIASIENRVYELSVLPMIPLAFQLHPLLTYLTIGVSEYPG